MVKMCLFQVQIGPLSNGTRSLFPGYGIEHAQCVPPSEFSEPSFITESYQTLHPISSEELLSLKYENDYPSVILRDPLQTDTLQTDYFAIKQEVVTPDNMCMGRTSRGRSDFFSRGSWVSEKLPNFVSFPGPKNRQILRAFQPGILARSTIMTKSMVSMLELAW